MPEALIQCRAMNVIRDGKTVLDGIDLDVRSGEIVTIIGPNGAGKTTLLRVLLGQETPSSGTVATRGGLRIGYVPQRMAVDPALPMTAARFLALSPGATADAVRNTLAETGGQSLATRQMSALSGGEIQRILMARALMREPDLLMLDEPTQGVDLGGEQDLYALITRLRDRRGCGILMVSHHVHVVMATTDRVICLNRHVCCNGRPSEVRRDSAYLQLFGTQAAALLGIYTHSHDHHHAPDGTVLDGEEPECLAAGTSR